MMIPLQSWRYKLITHIPESNVRIVEAELGLVRARHLGHPLPKRLNDQPGLDLADIVVSVPLLGEAAERVLDVGDARPRPLREQRGALVDVVDVELGVEALGCKEKTVLDTPISTEKQQQKASKCVSFLLKSKPAHKCEN